MKNKNKSQVIDPAMVDIVIPVRGRIDLLSKCIEAIPLAFDPYMVNIVVVDNNSKEVEEDVSYLDEFQGSYGNIKSAITIKLKENVGYPKACNIGARRKTSKYIFFLNSDCFLEPGSGKLLVDALDGDDKVGVVGMKLIFPDYPTGLDQSDKIRPKGKLQHIGLSTRITGTVHHVFIGWNPEHPKVNKVHEVFAVTGAALMVRRSLFMKAGAFYEEYGMGTYEDVDLCVTIKKMGYNIIVVPRAVGIHCTGATVETYKTGYPMQQNASIFLSRHMNDIEWWDYWLL